MAAAIAAAAMGAQTTILEGNDRIGKKLLMTGNGKCNFSNLSFSASCYYGECREKAWRILKRFNARETARFFERLGLLIKDRNGYLYPACEQAGAVLDVLRFTLSELGVDMICSAKADGIGKISGSGGFWCTCGTDKYTFDKVILACGGQAAPKTGSDGSGYALARAFGHPLVKTVPALVQLRCEESFFKAVAGVRCDAQLTLYANGREAARERGELQMTDYGISGIPVFQLSRTAAYALAEGKKVTVCLDLAPEYTMERWEALFEKRYESFRKRSAEELFTGVLNKKWMLYFMKRGKIKPEDRVGSIGFTRLLEVFRLMKGLFVTVKETNSFQNAQACAGGVSLESVDDDLQSVLVPGLYFAGELLDVDGRCGGYNLQWAWSSGITAGRAAAEGKGSKRS